MSPTVTVSPAEKLRRIATLAADASDNARGDKALYFSLSAMLWRHLQRMEEPHYNGRFLSSPDLPYCLYLRLAHAWLVCARAHTATGRPHYNAAVLALAHAANALLDAATLVETGAHSTLFANLPAPEPAPDGITAKKETQCSECGMWGALHVRYGARSWECQACGWSYQEAGDDSPLLEYVA